MAGDITLTVTGNLTADPELRFLPGGDAVANFTVASTPRFYDRQAGEWKNGETTFVPCSVWRDQAERFVDSAARGSRVVVTGRLKQRSWTTEDSEKHSRLEVQVDEVAFSVLFATATVTKATRPTRPVQDPWTQPVAA